jgi:hypothetical protein
VKIAVVGACEHNDWFARRLSERGLPVDVDGTLPLPDLKRLLGQTWSGLVVNNMLVDTGATSMVQRHVLASTLHALGIEYAELSGQWLHHGTEFGFAIFTGINAAHRTQLAPLLDALAPQPGAWLHCGPPGSGCYASRIFDALAMACVLALRAGWSGPGEPTRAPDWIAFFSQQKVLADKLLELSRLYLSLHPAHPVKDPWKQLESFSQPPMHQEHFSANLARLLVLALGHHTATREILDSVMSGVAHGAMPVTAA